MNVRRHLASNANSFLFVCYATTAAFLTYTAMYAVRKAFSAGTFEQLSFQGIDYKIWLVVAQTIGYTISKWLGIKVVAENTPRQRPYYIIALVAIAIGSLFLFAIVPAPYNIIFFFFNGLPIGMIFGLVFNYLEGRRTTEILVTGLTITQIFSSGLVKTIGQIFIHNINVSEKWMPFAVGICFFPVLIIAVWMLEQIPAQSKEDIVQKAQRAPMSAKERSHFVRNFLAGLFIFMFSYILMTAYRDFRDNFAAEIWSDLGFTGQSYLFTITEIPISLIILVMMIFLKQVRNNMKAFLYIHLMGVLGAAFLPISTLLYIYGMLSPILWISATGVGLYIAYVPANTIFFERMIAVFRYPANAGFVVIMADFYGYCGSFGVLLYKNFTNQKMSYASFFLTTSLVVGASLLITQLGSYLYFYTKHKKQNARNRLSEEEISLANI